VEREFFVYMMASKSRTLYVGMTGNLFSRVGQHKDGRTDGFTADYLCTRLVWYERSKYVRNAISREKQIKRWRREKKIWLIEQANPTWEDLAAHWGEPITLYCDLPENQ
jgi:putative endonuclease